MARLNQALVLYNRAIVGSAAASWDDYLAAVATIGRAEAGADTRGWLGQLITHRIAGLDVAAIAGHLAGSHDGIKATVELEAGARAGRSAWSATGRQGGRVVE